MSLFDQANAVFLPNVVSNNCPATLRFPTTLVSKSRPFRFANYIVDKPGFLEVVKEEWNKGNEACSLGYHMKQLNWQNGNLFERTKNLKIELKNAQRLFDHDPCNDELGRKCSNTLKLYNEACEDEEKLLFQKPKIDWLRNGDRNSTFFS